MGIRTNAIHDFNYQIHMLGSDGKVFETLAMANNFNVAKAAFEASLNERSWCTIELCNGGRIIEQATTGGYDTETKTVPILNRRK
ncbi:hypothetical protein [Mesorhizobium amorphae]|uniref:hypothetical protein n=1 Tax=Mesorhizobium amorphae TaxID=71433 RepID=UPI001186A5E2|nr:hypothetical protein [Mesorhizobium amorphae]